MAIDTINEKLAVMELEDIIEPGLPLSPSALGQDDRQQLLWGFPGVLWQAVGAAASAVFASTIFLSRVVRGTVR
jgi:hypothetical protein